MIDISERAQQHFLRLLSQQGSEGMSIRLRVTQPGTAAANCELEFCEPVDLIGGEWTIECAGFNFHVEGDSAQWLEGATIDFETNATGGQLNIRAPKIKGDVPSADAGLIERVPEITAVRDATDHAGGEKPYYSKTEGQSALG